MKKNSAKERGQTKSYYPQQIIIGKISNFFRVVSFLWSFLRIFHEDVFVCYSFILTTVYT